jgi:death-on-curing family protein
VIIIYPEKSDFSEFIKIISDGKYDVSEYLPKINSDWYNVVYDCVHYVQTTSPYEDGPTDIHDCAAKLIYKVAKRHELADGNKRTAVMVVYLFYVLNDFYIFNPKMIKNLAKRVAMTKGRQNEEIIKRRIANTLRANVLKQ